MLVLVTGGTGFVGRHLVPRLVDAGHTVRVLARGQHSTPLPAAVVLAKGDVAAGEGLDDAIHGADAIIHLVAVIRERGAHTFQAVNHQGTLNLIAAMRRGGVRRLLHMSALGAGPDPRYPYTLSKWQGEQAVQDSGLDYTIFRPSVLVGKDGGFVESLRQSAAPFPIFAPLPAGGRSRFQPVWVEDVVTCLLLAMQRSETIGRTYDLGGPEHLTYGQMMDIVLRARGLRRVLVPIPLALMRPAVLLMQKVLPNPPVTGAELAMLELDNTTALDSVERSFGFRPARMAEKLGLGP